MVNVEVDIKDASEGGCEGVDGKHDIVHVTKPNLELNVCLKIVLHKS